MVHFFTSKVLNISCGDQRLGQNILSFLMNGLIETSVSPFDDVFFPFELRGKEHHWLKIFTWIAICKNGESQILVIIHKWLISISVVRNASQLQPRSHQFSSNVWTAQPKNVFEFLILLKFTTWVIYFEIVLQGRSKKVHGQYVYASGGLLFGRSPGLQRSWNCFSLPGPTSFAWTIGTHCRGGIIFPEEASSVVKQVKELETGRKLLL